MKLSNKVALITGSSTGFGAAIAKRFAEEGATVVINYPVPELEAGASQVVAEITAAGGRAVAIRADVSNWDEVKAMVEHIRADCGSLDILVNNAAVNSYTPLDDLTLEQWERTIAVSLTGVFICVKHVLPVMLEQKKGNIINISSIAPWFAGKTVDYNAAKAGVIAITRTIAKHYGRLGVRANTIAPGWHATEMGKQVRDKIGVPYLDTIPIGYTGLPEDLANVALFLASDDSRYIHGHTLVSDGGITMR